MKIERGLSVDPFSFFQRRCYPPVKRCLTAHPGWLGAISIWSKWLSFIASLCGDTDTSYLGDSPQPCQLKDQSVIVVIVKPPSWEIVTSLLGLFALKTFFFVFSISLYQCIVINGGLCIFYIVKPLFTWVMFVLLLLFRNMMSKWHKVIFMFTRQSKCGLSSKLRWTNKYNSVFTDRQSFILGFFSAKYENPSVLRYTAEF